MGMASVHPLVNDVVACIVGESVTHSGYYTTLVQLHRAFPLYKFIFLVACLVALAFN